MDYEHRVLSGCVLVKYKKKDKTGSRQVKRRNKRRQVKKCDDDDLDLV